MGTEVEIPCVELTSDKVEVEIGSVDTCVESNTDISVQIAKKEYVITGDDIYISQVSDDAPAWLVDLIDTTVATTLPTDDMDAAILAINQAISEIEVAKNTYEESVLTQTEIDAIITARIATLNASIADNAANIVQLDTTKVTEAEAIAISANQIDASIANGSIEAEVSRIDTAIATEESSRTASVTALETAYNDNFAEVSEILTSTTDEYSVSANAVTEMRGYLSDENGTLVGGSSNLGQTLDVTADEVKAGFFYDNNITFGGVTYKSGFGLTATAGGTGTELDPYESEFWINAEKFKFTNIAGTGSSTPFTIDASGANPKIQMTADVEIDGNLTLVDNVDGGNITANSVVADKINTTGLVVQEVSDGTVSPAFEIKADGTAGPSNDANVYGATIRGGDVVGTSITGGSVTGTTGTFSGELTLGKLGNTNVTISNGVSYIPATVFDTVSMSGSGSTPVVVTYAGPQVRSTFSFILSGKLVAGSNPDVGGGRDGATALLHYSVDNGSSWILVGTRTYSGTSVESTDPYIAFAGNGLTVPVAGTAIRFRVTGNVSAVDGGSVSFQEGVVSISNLG